MTEQPAARFVPVAYVMATHSLTRARVLELIRTGGFTAVRVGIRNYSVELASVDAYFAANTVAPAEPATVGGAA